MQSTCNIYLNSKVTQTFYASVSLYFALFKRKMFEMANISNELIPVVEYIVADLANHFPYDFVQEIIGM